MSANVRTSDSKLVPDDTRTSLGRVQGVPDTPLFREGYVIESVSSREETPWAGRSARRTRERTTGSVDGPSFKTISAIETPLRCGALPSTAIGLHWQPIDRMGHWASSCNPGG